MAKPPSTKNVEQITHDAAKRKHIPTAEYQSVLDDAQKNPRQVRHACAESRRWRDGDRLTP